MALGSTDEFSRKNQSEADLHLTYLISRALYRFELRLVYFKCYARAIILYKLTIIVMIG